MHICIPDTREVKPLHGNAYLLYNIHIDGLYHCSLRYKQLLQLHQSLTKYFNTINNQSLATNGTINKQQQVVLPQFPPKKLLPLSSNQTEERRQLLEKYLQNISQDKAISNSSIFNLFLLEAQRESTRIKPNQVHLDIELVNGQKIKLQIVTHDSADTILKAVCRALNLKDRYHAYFCLCLCGYDVVRDKLIIKRRLSFFESPYITLQMAIQQQEHLQNVLVTSSNCINHHHHNHHHHRNPSSHYNHGSVSCNSTNINTSSSSSNNSGVSSSNSSSGSSNGYSSMTSQSSTNSTNCRCLNCSTRNFQLHHQQQQSNLTDVPSICSLSGSYNATSTNSNNLYNIDNSECENFNNISSSHYNNNNNINNTINTNQFNNDVNNNISNSSTINNSVNRGNNYSHQCYYTTTESSNNWLTSSASSSSSSSRSFVTHRILLRKSYWDPIYDTYILNDQQALNLLFIQTVYDMKHSLMFVDRETYHRLETLLATDQKLEYILLARTLKYYNHVHFEPCYSDYPRPRTKVMISIGSRELNMRVLKSPKSIISSTTTRNNRSTRSPTASSSSNDNTDSIGCHQSVHQQSITATTTNKNNPNVDSKQQLNKNEPILYCTSSLVPNGYHHLITKEDLIEEEYSFKVPLIRCWRLTSLETLNSNGLSNPSGGQTRTSMFGHRTTSSTATTLAGGKRKSLSLFNGVIGNAMNSNQNSDANQQRLEANSHHRRYSQQNHPVNNQFGTNGRSLLAAMANLVDSTNVSSDGDRSAFEDQFKSCPGNCCNDSPRRCAQCATNPTGALTHIDHSQFIQYELSFEYLMAKDTLKWITISSDQAIFISISLQGVVDELVSKRDGYVDAPFGSIERVRGQTFESQLLPPLNSGHSGNRLLQQQQQQQQQQNQNNTFTYLYRDGSHKILNIGNDQPLERFVSLMTSNLPVHQSSSSTHNATTRQQSRALSLFSSFASSGSGSSSATSVRGLIPVWSSSDLAGSSTSGTGISANARGGNQGSHFIPSCCGQPSTFEISSLRKEPSPIINDAFEGVMANDDDL